MEIPETFFEALHGEKTMAKGSRETKVFPNYRKN
jgi:hypothetical protein